MYKVHLGAPDKCTILDGHAHTLSIKNNILGTPECTCHLGHPDWPCLHSNHS